MIRLEVERVGIGGADSVLRLRCPQRSHSKLPTTSSPAHLPEIRFRRSDWLPGICIFKPPPQVIPTQEGLRTLLSATPFLMSVQQEGEALESRWDPLKMDLKAVNGVY